MIKDIYIIKNKFNDKVYIGQTVNPNQRWSQYKSAVKKTPDSQLITKAMSKYGFENFWMEILESGVENYDEREIYWINHYNSITPNGYNLAPGGQGIGNGINSPGALIKNEKTLYEIIDLIVQDEISLKDIAKQFNLPYMVISEINQGHTYFNPDLSYPLRNSKRYSEEKLKQITYSLKYELDKSLKEIADEYKIDRSYLNDINQGKSHFREYLNYPIRKGKMKYQQEYLPKLLWDLQNTAIPQKELAIKYNISAMTVSEVNQGKKGHQDNIEYPIRGEKERGRTCFSPSELELIYSDLRNTDLSLRQIGEKYGISSQAVGRINSGKIKKYYDPDIKYPIRKK